MYKIIAMDFDDTILTSDMKVTDYSKKILSLYKNKGYIIVGVTGRSLSSAKDVCDLSIFNYVILNNGTHIYDVDKNQAECINLLDINVCEKITKMFKNQAIKFDYCSLNNYYMTRLLNRQNKPFLIKINDISEVNEDISKMNIFLKENDNIEEIRDEINSKFEVNAFIMQDSTSSEKWLVINPKGLNKCTTLELLCKEHGLTLDNAIFFGDGLNDVELIQNAGLGVAMGNALPVVKSVSKDITLTNDEDGVAKYITNVLEYSAEGGFYDIL